MSLDFTPAPQAAPIADRVRAHAITESRLLLSNGEQNILALVIPIGVLIGGRFFGDRFHLPFEVIVPSVIALAIFSTCFTSIAITTAFERRYNVLERLAATPLGKTGVLLGKAGAVVIVCLVQIVVLAVVALILGWRPEFDVVHILVAVAALLIGAATFVGAALCMAGTARPELTLAAANLVYLAGAVAGIMLPVASYPEYLQLPISLLPTAAFGEALRFGSPWALLVLLVWGVGLLVLARKVFRWTS